MPLLTKLSQSTFMSRVLLKISFEKRSSCLCAFWCENACTYVCEGMKARRGHWMFSSTTHLLLSLRQHLFLNPGLTFSSLDWRPARHSYSSVSVSLGAGLGAGVTDMHSMPSSLHRCSDLNSRLHNCSANTLNHWGISIAKNTDFNNKNDYIQHSFDEQK